MHLASFSASTIRYRASARARLRFGLPANRLRNMIATVTLETVTEGSRSPDRFSTTRWSMVLACADSAAGEETARKALAELCKTYWRPIFAFICRRRYSVPDAQDLTQDFLLMVLEGDLLKRADPSRGKFRSLLLKALQNFLTDETIRKRAHKRGGEMKFVSWDEWMAEAPSHLAITAQEAESMACGKNFRCPLGSYGSRTCVPTPWRRMRSPWASPRI